MGSYLTIEEYCDRFGAAEIQRVTNDRTSTVVDVDDLKSYIEGTNPSPTADILLIADEGGLVDTAIADAESEVNSYLEGEYALPLSSVPRVLKNKVADMARHELHAKTPPEVVRTRYEDAIKWVIRIVKRQVNLALDTTDEPVVKDGGAKVIDKSDIKQRAVTDKQRSRFIDATLR